MGNLRDGQLEEVVCAAGPGAVHFLELPRGLHVEVLKALHCSDYGSKRGDTGKSHNVLELGHVAQDVVDLPIQEE